MERTYLWIFVVVFVCNQCRAAGVKDCGNYIGANIREYDYNFVNYPYPLTGLSDHETIPKLSYMNMEVVLDSSYYATSCDCGIVTMWQFYAWHPGNITFYVYDDAGKVAGKSSFLINKQSEFNFFEIPLSSDLWIPIRLGYKIGFYSYGDNDGLGPGEPMITYEEVTGEHSSGYYATGQSARNVGDSMLSPPGSSTINMRFAVAAYVIKAHRPMFVNADFTTTLYTHETSSTIPIYTAIVKDLDGIDKLTLSWTAASDFLFNTATGELYYVSRRSAYTTATVTLSVSDGCHDPVTANVYVTFLNEPPKIESLPASVTVKETDGGASLYKFSIFDASGDTVNCVKVRVVPNSGYSFFDLSGASVTGSGDIWIRSGVPSTPTYNYDTATHYDIQISCEDGYSTVYSNFQVYVERNKAPYFDSSGTGYLPAHISVDRTGGGKSIYQVDYADEEGDNVNVSKSGCDPISPCPFDVSPTTPTTGVITVNSVLDQEGYNLNIMLTDSHGNTAGPKTLSISTSGRPYTFNKPPAFVNLDHTLYVMENTKVGTTLFKVMFSDENPYDDFTLTKTPSSADPYFGFDSTTRLITVIGALDFETTGPGGWEMTFTLIDGVSTQHDTTASGTVTFTIVNVNEGVDLTLDTHAFSATELDSETNIGTYTATVESGMTPFLSMNCGRESKYFELETSGGNTMKIKIVREYDMDSGLSGFATCNITLRDKDGMTDTDQITITITNVNDNEPKFPHRHYLFFLSTTTTFFTEVANMSATDADSDTFGSTNGILMYSFNPKTNLEEYFQIDAAGILYVRNLTTFENNSYVFEIVATDSGTKTGTCTVTIVFGGYSTTTTTTTERSLVFTDDYQNYFWLLLIGLVIVATVIIIGLMIWFDPVIHEHMTLKLLRLSEWCNKKPKPKEPRRHVGKLKVTVNDKQLENDPDNALPWELLAKDADVPEVNQVQEEIQRRKERRDRDYKDFSGLPVFEKGRGARPDSGRATADSSSTRESDSPKYATFQAPPDEVEEVGHE